MKQQQLLGTVILLLGVVAVGPVARLVDAILDGENADWARHGFLVNFRMTLYFEIFKKILKKFESLIYTQINIIINIFFISKKINFDKIFFSLKKFILFAKNIA